MRHILYFIRNIVISNGFHRIVSLSGRFPEREKCGGVQRTDYNLNLYYLIFL